MSKQAHKPWVSLTKSDEKMSDGSNESQRSLPLKRSMRPAKSGSEGNESTSQGRKIICGSLRYERTEKNVTAGRSPEGTFKRIAGGASVMPRSKDSIATKSATLDKRREAVKSKKRKFIERNFVDETYSPERKARRKGERTLLPSSLRRSQKTVRGEVERERDVPRKELEEIEEERVEKDSSRNMRRKPTKVRRVLESESESERANSQVMNQHLSGSGSVKEGGKTTYVIDLENPINDVEDMEEDNYQSDSSKSRNQAREDDAVEEQGSNEDSDAYLVDEEEFGCDTRKECTLSGIDKLEADNDPLAELLRQQEKEITERRVERGEFKSKASYKRVGRRSGIIPGLSMEEYWLSEISRREKSFYVGTVAKLKKPILVKYTQGGSRRAESYKGIQVNEINNSDIRHCGGTIFGNVAKRGEGGEAWEQFRTVMGQFLRPCIAYNRVNLNDAWRPGELYKVANDQFVFRAFLQFFDGKGAKSSVMNKAKLLGRFVKGAIQYFHKKPQYRDNEHANKRHNAEMEETLMYLNAMVSTSKKLSNIERSRAKEEGPKIEAGKFVPEEDFTHFRATALENLKGIINSVSSEVAKLGKKDAENKVAVFRSMAVARPSLCDKWCLNMVGMMLFFGNGQRSQVYRKLKSPLIADLRVSLREKQKYNDKSPLKLHLVQSSTEKVIRNELIPYIMFDRVIVKYLLFHVEVVRPILLEKAEANEEPSTDNLLLHSRHGTPLNSKMVQNSCTTFIRKINPESHITPKDLRASFTTFMVRRYMRGLVTGTSDGNSFQALPLEDFKMMMAVIMNTSIAMLDKVYMEASHTSYGDHIAETLKLGYFGEEYDDEY